MTAKRLTTAIATGAVLLNALTPAAFATTIEVSGNGAYADNVVKVASQNTTVVEQNNTANVNNKVSSSASTGGNSASFNTGGDSVVKTGDAKSDTTIVNDLNTNKAVVEGCGSCAGGDVDITIEKNGAYSDNIVKVADVNETYVSQDNSAKVVNAVNADAKTGKNDANFNTNGDSVIVTGDATTNVDVSTKANKNVATVGGGNGSSNGSSVEIAENGAYSDNIVKLNDHSAVVLSQDNKAKIKNYVDAESATGKNDANFNTGEEVAIVTGDAKTDVDVENKVNFNAADVDCECLLSDLSVEINKNGAQSDNKVKADDASDLFVYSDNVAKLFNDVEGDAYTGKNDSDYNTGDPLVSTGDATSSTDVSNNGNVNLFNQGASAHLPGDWDVDVEFDFSALLAFFHMVG